MITLLVSNNCPTGVQLAQYSIMYNAYDCGGGEDKSNMWTLLGVNEYYVVKTTYDWGGEDKSNLCEPCWVIMHTTLSKFIQRLTVAHDYGSTSHTESIDGVK